MTSPGNKTATENVVEVRNWIDGVACLSQTGLFFQHDSPREESGSQEVPQSDLMDVVKAVQSMNHGINLWGKATQEERDQQIEKLLTQFRSALEDRSLELAEMIAIDTGMPLRYAENRSVKAAITLISEMSKLFSGQRFPPAGNSAVFLGWTDPLLSFCRRVPMLIAAGNAVCLKPSSRAPRTASLAAKLFIQAMSDAGLPLGLFALLNGHGAVTTSDQDAVGDALLRHPGFKNIYWIGRTDSALVARTTALEHGKRFHFVGSGRNPLILFQGLEAETQDRLLDRLALAITDPHSFGPYRPSRLFIQESIYKSVLESLAHKMSKLKVGDPFRPETEIGPLPKSEAERFDTQVRLALSETGHLVTGGHRNGLFAEPTLIRDLTNCSTLQSEELAGPWATIASFKYQHEALKYANTSPLGLASFVVHPEQAKARNVARKLEASRVFFSSEPPWPKALVEVSYPVKQSADGIDGLKGIYEHGQWTSTWFSDDPS